MCSGVWKKSQIVILTIILTIMLTIIRFGRQYINEITIEPDQSLIFTVACKKPLYF